MAAADAAAGVLRIVTAHRPPLVNVRNNGTAFSGMLIDMLPRMLELAEIKQPYEIYELASGGGGSLRANGTWSGVVGELMEGRANMSLFPLTLTSQRAQYIKATVPYMDSGYALLVKLVKTDQAYSFVLPFKTSTWLLILASLAAVILALFILDSCTRRARYRAMERLHGLDRAKLRKKRGRAMQAASESIFMLLGQGGAPASHSWSVKVLFMCWAVVSVILLSAYTANLTANLTVSRLGSTVKTLAELKRAGAFFGVPADSSVLRYFRESSDGLASSLVPMLIEYRSPADGVAAVRAGKIAAYAADFPVLKGFASEPPCDLSVSDETWGPGQLVIGLQPNSPLQARLDGALLRLSEEGVLSDLRRKWFTEMSACAALADSEHEAAEGLTVKNVAPVFYLLAGGAAFAALWAVVECLFYRFGYAKVTHLTRSASMKGAMQRLRSMRPSSRNSFPDGPSPGPGPDLPVSTRDTTGSGNGAATGVHWRGGKAAKGHPVGLLSDSTISSSDISDEFESDHWKYRVATDGAGAEVEEGGFIEMLDAPRANRGRGGGAAAADAGGADQQQRQQHHHHHHHHHHQQQQQQQQQQEEEQQQPLPPPQQQQQQPSQQQQQQQQQQPPPPPPQQQQHQEQQPPPPPQQQQQQQQQQEEAVEGGGGTSTSADGGGGTAAGNDAPSDAWQPVDGRWQPTGDAWRAPQMFRGSRPM